MPEYKLLALDLDGTLLNSRKVLTHRTAEALAAAADRGVAVVIATGRVQSALPEAVRALPFLRYLILVNGARVYDRVREETLYQAEIPWERAAEVMACLDALPVIYDCFLDNAAYMTAALKEKIDDFAPDEHYRAMLHDLRRPVPELKASLAEWGRNVQKVQLFTKDPALRQRLLRELPERFPDLLVTSSVVNNIELNARAAHKGAALSALAHHLRIPREETMAVGDGLNDLSMLQWAGLGVAMGNGDPPVRAAGDCVTDTCDREGAAAAVERFCLRELPEAY